MKNYFGLEEKDKLQDLTRLKEAVELNPAYAEGIGTFLRLYPELERQRADKQRKEMEKLRLSLEDLLCELRLKDIACIDEVDFAILEQNGKISVFKKGETALSHPIITDGVLQKDMLKEAEKDMKWLQDTLKAHEIRDIRRIFLLSVTNNGKVTLIEQKDTERSAP